MMKKYSFVFVLMLIVSPIMAQNIPSYVPKDGLIGWWPFNGNANDESGNGNHGTVFGATLTEDRNGVSNSAYSFNNNYIEIKPISKYSGMKDFTISTWVKLNQNSSADVNYLICRGQDAGGNLYLGHKRATYIFPGGGGAVTKTHTYVDVWNQITISRKDSIVSVYFNGILDSVYKNAQTYTTNNENIYFGVHKWITQLTGYYPYYLQGSLDDISIYNRALTQQEILGFYSSKSITLPSYLPKDSLIGYWPFNGNANDESGNGNHGTVNGATLTEDRNGVSNSAYSFNNNYIEIKPISKYSGMKDFTISTWVKLNQNSSADVNYLICRGQDAGGNLYLGHKRATYIFPGGGGAVTKTHTYVDVWNQITISRKDSIVSVYFNGILDSVYKNAQTYTTNNENIYFGVHKWITQLTGYYPYYLQGSLDDIAIYNRALTQQEILGFYSSKSITLPSYVPANGLMGWWPFNGNANDESGNGNDGVVSNVELTYDRFQKPNSCYSFNGKDSRIETVTQFFDVSLHSYTLSLWINTLTNGNVNNYNDSQPLLNTEKHNGIALGCLGPNNPFGQQYNSKYIVGIGSNPDQRVWDLNFDNSNTGFKIKSWEHLVLIKNGFNFSFYVNGILDKTFTISSNPIQYNAKMVFGALSKEIIAEVFNGQLDDIAIYNHALSEHEIKQLYNGCPKETATSSSFSYPTLTTSSPISLNAEPQGGTFNGIAIENNQFIPNKAKIGLNKVQYNFKNSQGCNDSTLFSMIVADTVGAKCTKIDTITVKNNVYDTITFKNNVYDTVTITNNVTKYDTINVTKYDTITVTNNVTKYDTLKVNTYDTITVTNNITKYDTVIVKNNVYDTVIVPKTVTKYDTVTITNNVTKYDTVKVTKFDTVTVKKNVYDTVIVPKTVTKYDTITVTNNVTKYDTVKINKTIFDTVTVTKNVTKYDTLKVTKFDTITVKNNVYDTVIITNNVIKYDTITLTDTVSILKITFKLTTGIQANQMASMSLYPNPTTDVLHIEIGDAKALDGYRYRILDALGKEVYNELVKNAITEIPLKTLGAAGMYQFEVLDQKNVRIQTNKIVLQ